MISAERREVASRRRSPSPASLVCVAYFAIHCAACRRGCRCAMATEPILCMERGDDVRAHRERAAGADRLPLLAFVPLLFVPFLLAP